MVLEKDALGLVQPEPMTAEKAKLNNPPARVVLTYHALTPIKGASSDNRTKGCG
jgi:hypothetical protein